MLLEKVLRLASSASSWSSSALVMMTVSGVFNSWEAAATNCRCCCQARSTGRTAHLESKTLTHRKARKLRPPIRRQVLRSPSSVARSLEMSANTRKRLMGASER